MKFLGTLVALAVVSVGSVASAQPNHWRFRLSATTYRFEQPSFSGPVELRDGKAVIGPSTGSAFVNYMDTQPGAELPRGPLFKEPSPPERAYLMPVAGTPGLYSLRYGASVPSSPHGVLAGDFAITPLDCGGQCGGLQLVYAPDSSTRRWLAYPNTAAPGTYLIRYWNSSGTPPTGGRNIWLWREIV